MRGCMVDNDGWDLRRGADEASAYIRVIFGKRANLKDSG